jgi:transposase-like protein
MPRKRAAAPSYSTRRRWTATEARAALAALAASGLSVNKFARREGLDEERLYRWRRRIAGERRSRATEPTPAARSSPELIEIRPRAAEPVEIVLVSGVVLRVSERADVAALARLVAALGRPSGGC